MKKSPPRRRPTALLAAATITLSGLVALGGTPATAAPAAPSASATSVRIDKIPTKKATSYGDVKVVPAITTKGNVLVSKYGFTIKKGGKTVVRDKRSAMLKAGTYKVTQKVTYRTFVNKTVYPVVFRAGEAFGGYLTGQTVDRCVVRGVDNTDPTTVPFNAECELSATEERYDENFDEFYEVTIGRWRVFTSGTYRPDDSSFTFAGGSEGLHFGIFGAGTELATSDMYVELPVDLKVKRIQRAYSKPVTKTKSQTLLVKRGPAIRTCASYSDFRKVVVDYDEPVEYGDSKARVKRLLRSAGKRVGVADSGDSVFEAREYKACKGGARIRVAFQDGYAYAKAYKD